jgi:hypothetical protein
MVRPGHNQAHGVPAGRVVAVKTYAVTARRWCYGCELRIDGLKDAEAMVREDIALELLRRSSRPRRRQ